MIDLTRACDFVIEGDCQEALDKLPSESFRTIYIDPPCDVIWNSN